MSLSLYMDHHVHAAITAALRDRGIEILTAFEDATHEWDDERLLERAARQGRVVFTNDDDFLAIAHRWLVDGREFAGIVYAHPLGITIGQAVRDLELLAKVCTPEDMRNRIEFLPFS